jgi:lipopolysaccharide transport system ATP-binding protein
VSDVIIRVEGLGKSYRLHHQRQEGYVALRDVLTVKTREIGRRLLGRKRNALDHDEEEFWALRDVSFEVRRGEVVGVIGRNGAGKSTLLKILSRITEPTEGRVRIRGRVASLLEVGTGFHPELTGRENIYLNGAILGMHRAEIKKKFDEIVAFAEVEKFLDTPVKRYSSGMYVRLAFAVAAHLDPDILIVDEVLAVGDAVFQKKCIGKMRDVATSSKRTVIFVSHNMAAVESLCSRGLMIESGRIAVASDIATTINVYLRENLNKESRVRWDDIAQAPGNDYIRLLSVNVGPPAGQNQITIDTGAMLIIEFFCNRARINLDCTIHVQNETGILMFESGCIISADEDSRVGYYVVSGVIPGHFLNAGGYTVTVQFGKDQSYVLFRREDEVSFWVEHTATGRGRNMNVSPGVVRPLIEWESRFSDTLPSVNQSG